MMPEAPTPLNPPAPESARQRRNSSLGGQDAVSLVIGNETGGSVTAPAEVVAQALKGEPQKALLVRQA